MPKISLDNLERYHEHLKDWCDARFAERKVHENWHEAGPSGAVSFYPVPNRPIDPVVNFAFTETLPEGTKGSDNPSMITGVSSITVTLCETVGVDETEYTVNLGGTYYGGSVDVSAGTMTVTHVCVVLDSSYTWPDTGAYNSSTGLKFLQGYGPSIFGENVVEGNSVCSHFVYGITSSAYVEAGTTTSPMYSLVGGGSQMRFGAPFSSAFAFMSWLDAQKANGTPVRVTGKLATPHTVQLTPTQIYSLSQPAPYVPRINTVYSNQQSVLVKYPKSPIVTGSELDNAILSLGGD